MTLEFYDKQIAEMATAVRLKLESDLHQFNSEHQLEAGDVKSESKGDAKGEEEDKIEMEKIVAPPYPELFASGCIINGFTPQDRRETESLVQAIREFKVNVVLVVDDEKLENDIRNMHKDKDILVIQLNKSGGVQTTKFDDKVILEKY